jgi:hypothetical protein
MMNKFETDHHLPKKHFDVLLRIAMIILFLACVFGILMARYKLEIDFMEKEIEGLTSEKEMLEADLTYYRKEYQKVVSK